jgi:antitoxin component YwqK of YwqJK toxin-antitoxin module
MRKLKLEQSFNIITVQKFIIFSICSFGLYTIWWQYKCWRFFNEKDDLDIWPVPRAIFPIFFLYNLLQRINKFSESKGLEKINQPFLIYITYCICVYSERLPYPFFLINFLAFLSLIQVVKVFNLALLSGRYEYTETKQYSVQQISLILIGLVLWCFVMFGVFYSNEDGVVYTHYDNGQVKTEFQFENGIQEGVQFFYYENGEIEESQEWSSGQLHGAVLAYNANGNIQTEGHVFGNIQVGLWKFYNHDGLLLSEENYMDGFRDYAWNYYRNGKLESEVDWDGDVQNGIYKEYYENGNLKYQGLWENDKQIDTWELYKENGELDSEGFID